ncbi:MAG: DNA polymerase Y family protein [Gammaproteobacteria bacterium]|nr:DNA polymerase Y family protein [Gammaproteobacteria bacterium]MDP6731688.1 DNA polymerase Y family protein [Gammaproteobacteria bacterium]
MEDPDSTDQLPLLSSSKPDTAQIIELPKSATARKSEFDKVQKPRRSLWYALYFPQLQDLPESRQAKALNELAGEVQHVSATVSFHPQALICEIRSSLKYFGGLDAVHNKLKPQLTARLRQQELPEHFLYAASPTVTGSLLLARYGHNALVYRQDNLRSALGQLPFDVLRLDKEQNRRLYNMGVRYLRDIWRLPADGLRKRFGSDFVKELNKALGKTPEPTRNYIPPPAFSTSYELPYELENLDRLLPVADEMLAQLCEFLRRRDLSTSHLRIFLQHENRGGTEIDMALRQASRSRQHLIMLLETHFGKLTIPAPVIAVKLDVKKFDAFMSHSDSLLAEDRPNPQHGNHGNLDQFMEQLQARLGDHYLKCIDSVAEHCPEYASQQLDYGESIGVGRCNKANREGRGVEKEVTPIPRPLWLLQDPQRLALRNGRLYHRKPVSLISGPERIETFWWSGTDVRRDYYVAREANGSRLWVYRERSGDRNWYLHGYFA